MMLLEPSMRHSKSNSVQQVKCSSPIYPSPWSITNPWEFNRRSVLNFLKPARNCSKVVLKSMPEGDQKATSQEHCQKPLIFIPRAILEIPWFPIEIHVIPKTSGVVIWKFLHPVPTHKLNRCNRSKRSTLFLHSPKQKQETQTLWPRAHYSSNKCTFRGTDPEF